ncbi:MAG: helix-turn-helix transcriptional regulator [Clostridia bacterium]|nr:helix-turn-helix transcriptional regulator [Clostridia bacterium]
MENSRFIRFHHNRYGFAFRIPPRELVYDDLTLLLDGTLEYRVDGEAVTLYGGDLVFMRQGEVRERYAGTEKANYVSFNFRSDRPYSLPRVMRKGVSREIQYLVAACDEVSRMPKEKSEQRLGYLLRCIMQLLEEGASVCYGELTEKILRYLHAHLAEKITLDDVGRQMHFSPVYCDTVFKREVGKSIIAYLLDERIEEAKSLLLEGTYSVREIARTVGFEDHNYFSRLFKRRVGYTPTKYRSSILGDRK